MPLLGADREILDLWGIALWDPTPANVRQTRRRFARLPAGFGVVDDRERALPPRGTRCWRTSSRSGAATWPAPTATSSTRLRRRCRSPTCCAGGSAGWSRLPTIVTASGEPGLSPKPRPRFHHRPHPPARNDRRVDHDGTCLTTDRIEALNQTGPRSFADQYRQP